ncbi:PREDICTED: uncharacterized protein LOC109115765 [Nelumbo nucifera]|uniref:Uncharacterized protein LOC109115765 n=1 Tax=Nelumbo nucifera TaxID=4432 RepID=A0A1U8QA29_NELNU|nr:PREDICTED: uncharacterized protein LOC109115765 [Nelumbo nucifera]XP_019055644.1 PREDICTED: uncharacterized protein LOC109115765 [Nelumbo nucifera]
MESRGFVEVARWRKSLRIETKEFLFEELKIKGHSSLKIREMKKAMVLVQGQEMVEWLMEFMSEAANRGKKPSRQEWSVETGRSYLMECKRNSKGSYISLSEFFAKGKKQMVCFPQGKNGQGWKEVASVLKTFFNSRRKGEDKGEGEVPRKTDAEVKRKDMFVMAHCQSLSTMTVNVRKGCWEDMMVLEANKPILEWRKVADMLIQKLNLRTTFILTPFNSFKVLLDPVENLIEVEALSFQDPLGSFSLFKWSPSSNSKPFHLWNHETAASIAMLCGVRLDVEFWGDLRSEALLVSGVKLEDIPRKVSINVGGRLDRLKMKGKNG